MKTQEQNGAPDQPKGVAGMRSGHRHQLGRGLAAGVVVAAVIAAGATLGAGLLGSPSRGVASQPVQHATERTAASSDCSYAFNVRDVRLLAGWATDVFLGRVVEQSGAGFYPSSNPDPSAAMPYTLYRVEVLQNLKGSLSGVVEVTQPGGMKADGTLDLIEDDPMLVAGEMCLFVTKGAYDPTVGPDDELEMLGLRPTIVNAFGDVRIRGDEEKTKVLGKYRTAVQQQLKPEL